MAGCSGEDNEVCVVGIAPIGEFFMLTGWFQDDWNSQPSSVRNNFLSNSVRLEAEFDGVPIELVDFGVEVINNTAFKTYTFQFPDWLQSDHILEVEYIDDGDGYKWTIRANLFTSGGGYPLGASVTSFQGGSAEPHQLGDYKTR